MKGAMSELKRISIPLANGRTEAFLPKRNLAGILVPPIGQYPYTADESGLIHGALDHPIDSPSLEELAREKTSMVIITSDHTRAMPSRVTLPILLHRIRKANPRIQITILVGTGGHRAMTESELREKFGEEIVCGETLVQHSAYDQESLVQIATLPSGNDLWINRLAAETELLVAEGLIEPHFFAGFSGGRKSILPGVAGYQSIMTNHCAEFIQHEDACTGNLDGNPVHQDMLAAAKWAKLAFILNVVLGEEGSIIKAYSGNFQTAHEQGIQFLREWFTVPRILGDIVITSNGGYPLDQNIYQAVKGMSTAESCCKPNGVIVIVAACQDGHGGDSFFRMMSSSETPEELHRRTCLVPREQTIPDQWEFQILSRILTHHRVILVTPYCDPMIIRAMRLEHAATLEDAVEKALQMQKKDARIVVIPNGVSTMVANDRLGRKPIREG